MALGTNYRSQGGAFLLTQTDGFGAHLELEVAIDTIRAFASSYEIAASDEEAEQLVTARREAIPSLQKLGRVSIGDIGVPRSRLADAAVGLDEISARTGVRIFTVTHASDGNLHPMILMKEEDSVTEGPAKVALGEMFYLARKLGGTLTGEHGIGTLKRDWLLPELGEISLEVQHAIKNALDPLNILNPGKAI